jgi:hypothetical protein
MVHDHAHRGGAVALADRPAGGEQAGQICRLRGAGVGSEQGRLSDY